jgi:hypothetical protein
MARRGILAPSGPRKHPGSTQFHCALIVDDADSCYDALLCLHVSRLRVSAHRQQRPQYGHIICRLAGCTSLYLGAARRRRRELACNEISLAFHSLPHRFGELVLTSEGHREERKEVSTCIPAGVPEKPQHWLASYLPRLPRPRKLRPPGSRSAGRLVARGAWQS